MNPSENTGFFPNGISHSRRDYNGLVTGMRAGHPDFDPFAIPLDEENLTVAQPHVSTLPSVIPANTKVSSVAQASPVPFHESLLQCPFCLSIFRSGVAGRLGICPVCAAVAMSPGGREAELSQSHVKECPPRLNRTGTIQPLPMRRSINRVAGGNIRNGGESSAPSLGSSRWGRLSLKVVVVLLVCGLFAALAGLAHSMEPPSIRFEPAHEIVPAPLTCGTQQNPISAGSPNHYLKGKQFERGFR